MVNKGTARFRLLPMRAFIRFFSFRSYFVFAAAIGVCLLVLLALGRVAGGVAAAVLAVYAAGAVLLHRRLRPPPTPRTEFDALAAFDRVLQEGRPTLLEFYSDDCAVCIANRPLIEGLENEVGHSLQILRINAKDAIGLAVADRYRVTFTPTYLLFNGRGEKEEEFVFVINLPRTLYWFNRQVGAA